MWKDLLLCYYFIYFYEFFGFFEGVSRVFLSDEVIDFVRCFKVLDDDK